jgi:hypothetical protein
MAGRDSFVLLFVGLFLVAIHLHAGILVAGETGVIGFGQGVASPAAGLTCTSGGPWRQPRTGKLSQRTFGLDSEILDGARSRVKRTRALPILSAGRTLDFEESG